MLYDYSPRRFAARPALKDMKRGQLQTFKNAILKWALFVDEQAINRATIRLCMSTSMTVARRSLATFARREAPKPQVLTNLLKRQRHHLNS